MDKTQYLLPIAVTGFITGLVLAMRPDRWSRWWSRYMAGARSCWFASRALRSWSP